jgi:hypothetical protein
MAEVFKGEAMSVQGFKKQVAIKRVLPHLAQNKNFISMFLDEARLGARLTHANIVTRSSTSAPRDNTFFIVMEFIDGCNLKAVIEDHRQQGRRLPREGRVYIAIETCKGLSYAHEVQDDDGNDLHIVHRDISPPNVLISKRGEVKVTDFGLAKATTQLEKTDPGVVKGKFSYLSPEAALGESVDMKTDVYATGIVLWEMLAGRRLYLYQTVKLVARRDYQTVGKLEKDPTKRPERAQRCPRAVPLLAPAEGDLVLGRDGRRGHEPLRHARGSRVARGRGSEGEPAARERAEQAREACTGRRARVRPARAATSGRAREAAQDDGRGREGSPRRGAQVERAPLRRHRDRRDRGRRRGGLLRRLPGLRPTSAASWADAYFGASWAEAYFGASWAEAYFGASCARLSLRTGARATRRRPRSEPGRRARSDRVL